MYACLAKTVVPNKPTYPQFSGRKQYVRERLLELGLGRRELLRAEAKHLPYVLHRGESINAVISGKSEMGHIMIVAADRRVIVMDCKPMFNSAEDITYSVVAGVSVTYSGLFSIVTLHTRVGDFKVKTSRLSLAQRFKQYIDERCIENQHQANSGAGGML